MPGPKTMMKLMTSIYFLKVLRNIKILEVSSTLEIYISIFFFGGGLLGKAFILEQHSQRPCISFFLKIYSQRVWSKLLSFNYPLGYWSYCITLSLKKSKGVSKDFIFLLRMQSFHPLYQKYEKLGSDFIKPLYLRLVKGKVFILAPEKRTIFNTL